MSFKQTSIYVFYEDIAVLDIIQSLITSMFDDVTPINVKSDQSKFVQTLSGEHTSIIFIYAFDSAADAEQLSNLLHGHDALNNQSHIPRFEILLCDKSSRLDAYDLCEKNQFYTYEIIKPIYDTNRVKLTLKRLAEHLQSDVELLKVAEDNAELFQTLSQSIDSIAQLRTKVDVQADQQAEDLNEITKPLDELLDNVPAVEWQKAFSSIISSLPEPLQKASARDFSMSTFRENLETYKDNSVGSLQAFSSMLETVKPHMKSERPIVMVADDQPVMQKIIATILEPRGFKVELASNGVEAIMKAKVMIPQLILLDIDMPIMDGLATLQAMKQVEITKNIPVIMLTSHADKSMIQASIDNGASDYVVKPTRADLLLKKIAKVINQS